MCVCVIEQCARRMPRATRARTRGVLLKEKTPAEENAQASVTAVDDAATLMSPKAAVGRGKAAALGKAAAAPMDGDAAEAEAKKREFERELAGLDAERTRRLHHTSTQRLYIAWYSQRAHRLPPHPRLIFFARERGEKKAPTNS